LEAHIKEFERAIATHHRQQWKVFEAFRRQREEEKSAKCAKRRKEQRSSENALGHAEPRHEHAI
jgi:hypothetical protein